MPQVYHLFTARGVRGGVPGGRTMTSRGVRAGPSGGRESKTAPVSAIRFFACFSPLPSRFSPFLSRFAALRAVSSRSASGRIATPLASADIPSTAGRSSPPGPAMTGASGTALPAANASASAAARARISSSCRFPMLAPVAASTRSCPSWNDPARHAISASRCSRQEYPHGGRFSTASRQCRSGTPLLLDR